MADVVLGAYDSTEAYGASMVFHGQSAEELMEGGYRFRAHVPHSDVLRSAKLTEQFEGKLLRGTTSLSSGTSRRVDSASLHVSLDQDTRLYIWYCYGDEDSEYDDFNVDVWSKISPKHATDKAIELAAKYAVEKPKPEGHTVRMELCNWGNGQLNTTRKTILVNPWEDVEKNYPLACREMLTKICGRRTFSEAEGKLLLLHGPPGTGKTSLLRALAWEWRKEYYYYVILDPAVFLSNPAYMNAMMGIDHGKYSKLLIMEDCGDIIANGAQTNGSFGGLSSLLNLADGIVGQGQKMMFAITTNIAFDKLDPAATRPGRCFAKVDIGNFEAEEASERLGRKILKPMSLADIYADGYDSLAESAETGQEVGQYL